MRKVFIALLACIFFIGSNVVWANQPPPHKTLVERVELATHVIVGAAKKVTAVEFKDGELQEVNPQPVNLHPFDQAALIEIEIEEAMYPSGWKPKQTIKYLFGGGHFEMESIRNDVVGKKLIYVMKLNPYEGLKDETFLPSYEWHLAEALEKKVDIQAVLDARIKREEKQKQ